MAAPNNDISENGRDKDTSYFAYYGQLTHQQNMLQDAVRTSTYYNAIHQCGPSDIKNKVVMDVGAGSGILSFFAAQAGASRIYAVEAASEIAAHAKALVKGNGWDSVITVVEGKVEDLRGDQVPDQIDILISEPMGVLLVHERMIESYIEARDRWLKPVEVVDGKPVYSPSQMLPSSGSIFLAPFSDSNLYALTHEKVKFWQTDSFYGVDLSNLSGPAHDHFFGQPIVGGFDPKTLLSAAIETPIPFYSISKTDLQRLSIPVDFQIDTTGICHGIAGWFSVSFEGSSADPLVLNTGPEDARTHWHQVRFLFRNPLALNRGQRLQGLMLLQANDQRSYDILLDLSLDGGQVDICIKQSFALHDQQYWNLSVNPSTSNVNLDYLSLYPETI